MRFRVHTQSGSIYTIDDTAMTWERNNPKIGIIGYDKSSGRLTDRPEIIMNKRMHLDIADKNGTDWILTTPVTMATIIDDQPTTNKD